ncbi:MAG: putative ABC transporter permease, partial [Lachnospiraceae bacterium]|nr:putative ABC transporter permease [Lachnospiraceae bacterium]
MSKKSARKLIPLLMLIFTIAGVIGFIYEEICGYINEGHFFKRGTTFGPWIPIYGFGALLVFALTFRIRKKPLLVFLIATVACG